MLNVYNVINQYVVFDDVSGDSYGVVELEGEDKKRHFARTSWLPHAGDSVQIGRAHV